MKWYYGKKNFINTDNLESEIGDVLFSFICIVNNLNIDLKEAFNKVVEKYNSRFLENGHIGSGK